MKKLLFISILIFSTAALIPQKSRSQQLPQFSQYIFNGLTINPAYAGYKGQGYIQSTFRKQWMNFPGSPQTFSLTADLSANDGLVGIGVSLLSDQIGATKTTSGIISYAHRIQTAENSFLSLGVGGGASQYLFDGGLLIAKDPSDPDLPFDTQVMFTPNLNTGILFHSTHFYAGISAFNLVGRKTLERGDIALSFHDIHYYITAGLMLPISDNVEFKPSFLIREVKGAPINYDINGMFLFFDRLWLGASYRSNMQIGNDSIEGNFILNNRTALAFIVEVFVTPDLRLGYAYDKNLNALENYRNNSHEFSLGYYITKKASKVKNPRWF
ncbi:type IX secretion system membrane protein PorP/SprF [Shivajiella indica]|uniref:Type IX secretion system membrane protein PorP/SprF n=1 Tax=Shivajiella indica TaxID=872115 RepID=A0ABW5B790_9BACT